MKIRSITLFLNPGWPLELRLIDEAGQTARQARSQLTDAGYEVQTIRLATVPFPILFAGLTFTEKLRAVQELEKAAISAGFNYTAIGPALIEDPESYAQIPEIIASTETIFCSAEIATRADGLSLPAVQASAEIITKLAPQDPNGFANLYFTALANVPPGSPFFPGGYHTQDPPAFALATEAAGLAVTAFKTATSLQEGLAGLKTAVENHAARLTEVSEEISRKSGTAFKGIDFSLAPFPDPAHSLGAALEGMGIPKVGLHGSLAAAALLASTLDQAKFYRIGFSGLFFPLLEDAALADRAAEGVLTVKDLLMYSAVCGTGLDTIPLPGNTTPEQLAPLLLDLGALALRLDKPLTARIMPVPGKQAGERTSFDFPFFANSRVLPLSSEGLNQHLARLPLIPIQPRQKPGQ
jgi:uncharacterized protein (UPF0210 family)